jgi:hypothetical protein
LKTSIPCRNRIIIARTMQQSPQTIAGTGILRKNDLYNNDLNQF